MESAPYVGDNAQWLWVFNPQDREQAVTIDLSKAWGDIADVAFAWGHQDVRLEGRRLWLAMKGKDAVMAQLT